MIDTQWQKERGGKGGMAGHWLGKSQWALPTAKNYEWLRGLLNNGEAGLFLSREYEDLRREYEDLRREYEDLRRPFSLDRYGAFSDVWQFSPVAPHDGRHICEKPQEMLMRILEVSTRPGAVVFDSFFGSGSMGEACGKMGRRFWGSEMSADWFDKARRRVAGAFDSPVGTNREPVQVRAVKRSGSEPANFEQLGLFG
jgi:site-specific DNA-methyltransferase (adenine-specific)